MLRAILSDIHGNLEALEAVLADLERERPAALACLGDFVGYGASPNECVATLRPRCEAAVIGNHDLAAIGRLKLGGFNSDAAAAARWTDETLTDETRAWLTQLPYSVAWHDTRLVHASPAQPEEWHYVLSPHDASLEFESFAESLCLIGHSHYPGAFEFDGKDIRYSRVPELALEKGRRYIVNVGSVGQPRDGDPRAAYLLWDDRAGMVRHVRVAYDVDRAMQRIRDANLPAFLAERLRWGE
ncbi:MAG TPA: metallophosphoesterase family protein [Candidatus Saccharimonadaceae bacterium]|jgi:diadenosine tetraphosphatase ApaH/serine/threonine PP2A family protein phosphatase|nr:metallophosphoesterase family protein [Candidatus Saccharimonadaceae bacterium]